MGKPTGFLDYNRETAKVLPPKVRIANFNEFRTPLSKEKQRLQGARCMACGVPFCQSGMMLGGMASGCPLHNLVPETNDLVYTGNWKQAYLRLSKTHSFPEFTSRVCPALCEAACTCNLNGEPVATKENERAIIETAYKEGWVQPQKPNVRTGKTIAVIGSGPSGLAAAQQLNRRGHSVTVFEREDKIGGLLRYGIPNMKLEKQFIDRKIAIMEEEGVQFVTGCNIGKDKKAATLLKEFDRVVLCCGASNPRDIKVPGREAEGIYFAVDFLKSTTKALWKNAKQNADGTYDLSLKEGTYITAKGKNVMVIGGGDTGSDCIGTSIRQGAACVTQIEIMPKPPVAHNPATPWPQWPAVLKTTSSHEEGCIRRWSLTSNRFLGKNGKVTGVEVEEVEWLPDPVNERSIMKPTGKKEIIEADMVLLAMGFLKPEQPVFAENVFIAGDAATGASLVVRAMASGRAAATEIEKYLNAKR